MFCILFKIHTIKWWYSLKQGDSLAKTKFVSWYHAGCQNIHTLSYDQLGDSELNISWHCIICNNPNYSYTVHDYQSIEITSDGHISESLMSLSSHVSVPMMISGLILSITFDNLHSLDLID
jgi:hypothetical protein